jgi:two-component system sensor histidine kinase SenX3
MFWRLFLTYLLLVAAAVGLVGGLVLQRVDDPWGLARDVAAAVAAIVVLAVGSAYLLARRFTRPLVELTGGAERLAEGDFGLRIRPAGSREVRALAQSFNAMTDRLAATFAELAHDREQLRTVLSGMVEGVVAFDAEQRVLFANDRAAQLLEFAPEQAVGRRLWEITRQRAVQELADKALHGGGPVREELDWKGPADRSLAVYASRLPGPGSPGAVMVLHDVSEIRRLERMRQDFVANVSHELKTPVGAIGLLAEAIEDAAEDEDAVRRFAQRLHKESARLTALVHDIIELSRLQGADVVTEGRPVDLNQVVADAVDRNRFPAENKGIEIVVGGRTTRPVFGDHDLLVTALRNLVDNAIHYSPEGTRVGVGVRERDGMAQITVADQGPGIPEDEQDRIFERFYRVDTARSRRTGGTGLGLSIVKHVMSQHGGEAAVWSQPGRGSTFTLSIPQIEGADDVEDAARRTGGTNSATAQDPASRPPAAARTPAGRAPAAPPASTPAAPTPAAPSPAAPSPAAPTPAASTPRPAAPATRTGSTEEPQ